MPTDADGNTDCSNMVRCKNCTNSSNCEPYPAAQIDRLAGLISLGVDSKNLVNCSNMTGCKDCHGCIFILQVTQD